LQPILRDAAKWPLLRMRSVFCFSLVLMVRRRFSAVSNHGHESILAAILRDAR
jgi:hypothetical protein